MSVGSELDKVQVVGDGSASPIAFNRKVFNDSDVVGESYDPTTGVTTELKLGTHFTVSGAGNTSTGVTVTPSSVIPVGVIWTIWTDQSNDQSSVWKENDRFPAKQTEYAMDKLAIGIQELGRDVGLSLKFPNSEISGSINTLPSAKERAGKAVTFDDDGNIQVSSLGGSSSLVNNALNVDFDAGGVGSVTRSVESKLREHVSVEDYSGDGITDSAATQAAINAVNAAGGGVVEFTKPSYSFESTVTIKDNVHIDGGWCTIIQASDGISCFYGSGVDNFSIQKFNFSGKTDVSGHLSGTGVGRSEANQAIKLIGTCTNYRIAHNSITGFVNHGILLYGSTDGLIEHNHIYDIGQRNSSLDTPINSGNFSNYSGGLSCLYIDGDTTDFHTRLEVRHNKIHGCLNTALSLVYAKGVTNVWGNDIYDSDSNAFQWGTGCEVVRCYQNKTHDLTGLYDTANEGYGISMHQDSAHSEVFDNRVWNTTKGGINAKACEYAIIRGNYLENSNSNGNTASILGWGVGQKISDNYLIDQQFTCINVSCVEGEVSGNRIEMGSASNHTGIAVNTTFNASATNITVRDNVSLTDGLLISVSAPNAILEENRRFAMFTSGSDTHYFRNNDISQYRNDTYGLRLTGTTNGIVIGGTNTATTKYQNNGTGNLWISPTTDDYRRVYYGSAAPVAGTWSQADVIYDITPTAGGTIGWVCVSGGTPGTWKTFGAITA